LLLCIFINGRRRQDKSEEVRIFRKEYLESEISCTKTLEFPIKELTIGSTFPGRYTIIEELGKGGVGKALDKC
jgi:hypothetical protein